MIDCQFDKAHAIVHIRPESSLDKRDFAQLAALVDPEIEAGGTLAGLIIDAPHFPGWDSFGALVTHLRFVRDHHKHVKKVALVTDSRLGNLVEHLASHFVAADIRPFPGGQVEQARHWIIGEE